MEDNAGRVTTEREPEASQATPPLWPGLAAATAQCLRFFSRLPAPALPGEADVHAAPDFRLVPRVLPLAALLIAAPAALVVLLLGLAGLDPLLNAALAISVLAVTTGALHEDGLADSADGLFGGRTPETRLTIMKDSRVGSFGATALALALLLRVAGLAAIVEATGPGAGAAAVLVAAAWSRAEAIRLLSWHDPARPDGTAASVGRPTRETALRGLSLAGAFAAVAIMVAGLPLGGVVIGLAMASLLVTGLGRLAKGLIGGVTGDSVGAAQQVAEIAVYLGIALVLGWSRT